MRALTVFALSAALSGCAGGGLGSAGKVNPGKAVLAADIAQNRFAQDIGVLAALRATAAPDAILFAPGPVDARNWLEDQEPFPDGTAWRAARVLVSCDGTMGVVTGAIRWGDYPGYYTTIWRYGAVGEGERGDWRWVFSHGDGAEQEGPAPKQPLVTAASCDALPAGGAPDAQAGGSRDGSLRYRWTYDKASGRALLVELWDGETFVTALEDTIAPGQAE